MIQIFTELGLNAFVFLVVAFLTFIAAKVSRKRNLSKRRKYLSDTYKCDEEIEFICKDFDFFDHDESYNKDLIEITISTIGTIQYDFNKSASENIKQGHFWKIAKFIKEFYSQHNLNPASLIKECAEEIDLSKQYDYIQYGVNEIFRSRKDHQGRLEASVLYLKLQKIAPHTALLIDSIYKKLRLIDETPLRLKSRELKYKVDQRESISDLNRMLIFLSTVRYTGLIAQKKQKKAIPDLLFKVNKNQDFAYTYDFPLTNQKEKIDYEIDIMDHVKNELNLISDNKEAISISITDICFNYTEGFHLKFLSYVGYTDPLEIKKTDLRPVSIQYTELKSHLTYKCPDVEIALYALSLSKKASNNIPCFLNNLN